MVEITGVEKGSIGAKCGFAAGDKILAINGHEIIDVLDYRFYCTEKKLVIECEKQGIRKKIKIHKAQYDDLGLQFETYLMDKQRSCRNSCIFCFIDQMPSGLRPSLYFKDDDARLSFLFGNYITLTNINDREIDRIITMHISPVNISVHTTNPELRCKMMGNRFAGESLKYLYRLARAGIKLNCQLVLCPGINDGEELKRTLTDLCALWPSVQSIAAVPVGLTQYREGLTPLQPYTKQTAAQVISILESFGDKCEKENGDRLVYPADEFFILAEEPMPDEDYYGAMLQLENGVGMCALLKSEFESHCDALDGVCSGAKKTIATGKGAYPLIKSLVDYARRKWHNINCEVVAVENMFFGPLITTAGLITGKDLIRTFKDRDDIGTLLISASMLRQEGDLFLDDLTVRDVSEAIGAPVEVPGASGAALLNAILK